MEQFNIYLTGVGGQGIGMVSEIILRAADYAGLRVKSVDTHGLAQRGGIVISQIRIGDNVYSPLIPKGEADLVVALERHEAMRGMNTTLKNGGTLVYYNASWQPLEVRMNQAEETTEEIISETCRKRGIQEVKVSAEDLEDSRMQNIALLSNIAKINLIPNIEIKRYKQAMEDLMPSHILEKNMNLLDNILST